MKRCHLLAIGCGPFNLSLAALASGVRGLDFVALEATKELRWHSGLMLDDATLQVSFLADLVTLVEPTHPLSFLAYLKAKDRMYPFYIRERFHITRLEYEDYLRWAVEQLPSVRFSHRVEEVEWSEAERAFTVRFTNSAGATDTILAQHLALGIGTAPYTPEPLRGVSKDRSAHSSDYLPRLEDIRRSPRVTIIGSGQSGAEVFLDLLRRGFPGEPQLSWLTRTGAFSPLDYTKIVLEMTTPEYVDYFHALPEQRRNELVAEQWRHYKGISTGTIEELHEEFYRRLAHHGDTGVELRHGTAVLGCREDDDGLTLTCHHRDTDRRFEHKTDFIVAATGYRHRPADFLAAVEPKLARDRSGRWQIRRDHSIESDLPGRIFVSNCDLHSHGVAAPDLGIGAVRSATMLNTILPQPVFQLPQSTAFARFNPPEDHAVSEPRARPAPEARP
ncbi:MAG: SidA/IucD/PvdA family monooxygenase [Myxococcota bacterium]